MSILYFFLAKDIEDFGKGKCVAPVHRGAVLTFLAPPCSHPKFLRLREKSFADTLKSQADPDTYTTFKFNQ